MAAGTALRRAAALLWFTLAIALVVLALTVSLGRYYLRNVAEYQDLLLAELHRQTGLTVTADSLAGDWRRLVPELRATHLSLLHPVSGEPVLRAEQASLRLDLLGSLWAAAPRIHQLSARGVDIELEEAALGRWYLRGFSATGEGDAEAALELLLGITQARFEQVRLQLRFAAGHDSLVQSQHLQLVRSGDFRRLLGDLRLGGDQPPVELVVEASGDPRQLGVFRARGHARFMGVDLSPVLPLLEPLGVELQQGQVDGEFWLEWQGDRQFTAQGSLSVPELDLAGLSGRDLQPLTDVALQMRLQAGRDDWQLWVPSLQANWAGHALQLDRLWLQRTADGTLDLGLPRLALAPLAGALSGSGLLRETHRQLLEELAPRGNLVHLRLHRPATGEAVLRTELDNVGLDPWEGAPGADGVDGYLEAGLRQGQVVLASRDLQLWFPHVYDHVLQIDQAGAALRWQLDDQRIRVHSGPISARAELGEVAGHLSLDLPLRGGSEQPPEMTLVLGLKDSHSQYRDQLVPTLLHEGLLEWLESSIGPARVPEGGFIYRGSLRGDDTEGRTVQLLLEVRDGELDYQPPWPALRGIDARVLIDDGNTQVDARTAQALAQTSISTARFGFDPDTGRLSGHARLRSADADVMSLITTTPLRQWVADTMDDWRWQGPVQVQLDLDLPLFDLSLPDGMEPDIAVSAELGPGRLDLGGLGLTVTDLQGPLRYRTATVPVGAAQSSGATVGLSSAGLSGKLFGKPLQGRLGQSDDQVWLDLDAAELSVADLQSWLQLPLPLDDIAEGSSPAQARIEIGAAGSRVQASSDLRGVTINLPEPWGKTAQQPMPLRLHMPLSDGPLELSVGEDLRLAWQRNADTGGAIALGAAALPALIPGRIRIAGELQRVDFNHWQDSLQGLGLQGSGLQGPGNMPGADGAGMPVEITSLRVASLPLLGQTFSGVRIAGGNRDDGWRLQLHADQLSGELVLPAPSGAPLAIWLGRLDLSSGGDDTSQNDIGTAVASLDPAAFPDLELEFAVGALRLDGELVGGLRFDLQPLEDGLRLKTLGGSLRGVSITGSPDQMGAQLDWRTGEQGSYSEFRGRLLSGDLAGVLNAFGYERALTSARSVVDARLDWPGRPDQLSLAGLSGEMELVIEEGRFIKVSEPTSGALKALGIFNLANLTRRLRLDFSDIFSSGVSFNRLDAQLHFDRGLVETLSPLRVTSPSSRFQATGNVDFNTDLVQMELVATLPIASNLPWVVALAGGLPAAAGVYIVSKLFEEQMDRYSSVVYRIDGNWADPHIEFVRVFDDLDSLDPSAGASRSAPVMPVDPDRE